MGGVAEGICLAGIGSKREGHNCIMDQNYPVSTIFLEVPVRGGLTEKWVLKCLSNTMSSPNQFKKSDQTGSDTNQTGPKFP